MSLSYSTLSCSTAASCWLLASSLVLAPEQTYLKGVLSPTSLANPSFIQGASYMGRRGACLFFVVGYSAWSVRNEPSSSVVRKSVSTGIGWGMAILAAVGAWEWLGNPSGMADANIAGAVVAEVLSAVAHLYFAYGENESKKFS